MKIRFLKEITLIIAFICIFPILLCSCNSHGIIEYYSEKENYISVTGTVSSMTYNKDSTALYIDFSDLYPVLDDTCFKIVGRNLETVKFNKIDDNLRIGERITFVTAPQYFGDGYVMPIVAISIGGENMLDFEEGYKNWIDWLSQ